MIHTKKYRQFFAKESINENGNPYAGHKETLSRSNTRIRSTSSHKSETRIRNSTSSKNKTRIEKKKKDRNYFEFCPTFDKDGLHFSNV